MRHRRHQCIEHRAYLPPGGLRLASLPCQVDCGLWKGLGTHRKTINITGVSKQDGMCFWVGTHWRRSVLAERAGRACWRLLLWQAALVGRVADCGLSCMHGASGRRDGSVATIFMLDQHGSAMSPTRPGVIPAPPHHGCGGAAAKRSDTSGSCSSRITASWRGSPRPS